MPPSQDDDDLAESPDEIDEAPARSLVETTWFRVVLVFLGIAVVAAISLPYVIDHVNAPSTPPRIAKPGAPVSPVPASSAPATQPGSGNQSAPAAAATSRATTQPTQDPAMSTPRATAPAENAPVAQAPKLPAVTTKSIARATAGSSGDYWVQVGAFRDPGTAKRLAAALRRDNFTVSESTMIVRAAEPHAPTKPEPAASPVAGDRYEVYVSGGTVANLNAKLTSKGLSVDSAAEGVVVRPSLPLRDAVSVSKQLAAEGFKVQVKRASAAAPAATATPSTAVTPEPRETLHRVRIGAFPDRAAAAAAMRELEAKGFKAFIARGRE
jgi:cell division protein FtsN